MTYIQRATATLLSMVAFLWGCGPQSSFEPGDASFTLQANSDGTQPATATAPYLVGTGRSDLTGPIAGVTLLGYARLKQVAAGLHTRQKARASIIVDRDTGKRAAVVVADLGMVTQAIHQEALRRVKRKFGELYTARNVVLSATHTHSAPGGIAHHRLYNAIVGGYNSRYFDFLVDRIVDAIAKAHENLGPGRLALAQGVLKNANINRSPEAYRANPPRERKRYAHDTDKTMSVLSLTRADGSKAGLISWFPVHPVSMENTNRLVSSDNKGAASYFLENRVRSGENANGSFIAAFANANAGDASPNTATDLDGDGDWDCPLNADIPCTLDSGQKQAKTAWKLANGSATPLSGPVASVQVYKDFSSVNIASSFANGATDQSTCPAAIGAAKVAGSKEDGPGLSFVSEGLQCGGDSWMSQLFCKAQTTSCQGEKPVVLETGGFEPALTPQTLPLQIVRIGRVALLSVPAEFTTMAGRRLRETVREILAPAGIDRMVVAGYSNGYAGYVTTREEYAKQEYEGASTHFGPWTLAAYRQGFSALARELTGPQTAPTDDPPLDLSQAARMEIPSALFDRTPWGAGFGDIVDSAKPRYERGDTARVSFWGAHPRHHFQKAKPYLEIQHRESGQWKTVATGEDVTTVLHWQREGVAKSKITVEWRIPTTAPPGRYRIVHHGTANPIFAPEETYTGTSAPFAIKR